MRVTVVPARGADMLGHPSQIPPTGAGSAGRAGLTASRSELPAALDALVELLTSLWVEEAFTRVAQERLTTRISQGEDAA